MWFLGGGHILPATTFFIWPQIMQSECTVLIKVIASIFNWTWKILLTWPYGENLFCMPIYSILHLFLWLHLITSSIDEKYTWLDLSHRCLFHGMVQPPTVKTIEWTINCNLSAKRIHTSLKQTKRNLVNAYFTLAVLMRIQFWSIHDIHL